MAQATFSVRMDETLKKQFDSLCAEFGMNATTAFNIFARTVVRERRIPFEISLNVPNAETLAAIDDVNHERNLSRTFHSVADLMEDLNA